MTGQGDCLSDVDDVADLLAVAGAHGCVTGSQNSEPGSLQISLNAGIGNHLI
jgi:hypothetical protein